MIEEVFQVSQNNLHSLVTRRNKEPKGSPEKVLYKIRKERSLVSQKMIKKWHQTFLKTGSSKACRIETRNVDRVAVINHYLENPRQSLRRGAACLDIPVFAVRSGFKTLE